MNARAAHGRRRRSPAEDHLRLLGKQIPPPKPEIVRAQAHERAHRDVPRFLLTLVLAVVVALVAVQWFRPIPRPVFRSSLSGGLRLAGALPSLPWPATGSAALSAAGAGSFGHAGPTTAVPIASLAKVLTAYVVLKDHPLTPGSSGPSIAVPADVVAAYKAGVAAQQSELAVTPGETLNELQALEGLLVAGANDMATLLGEWDAGSTSAFVEKMDASARLLGLSSTHITDPSGLDPATVSTPADLIRLGEAAMALPAFAQMVAMAQVTLPVAGTIYNLDADLGTDGFVGIKTGNDTAAGGCFLFDAQQAVDGQSLTLVGVVLGQDTTTPTAAALGAADALVRAAFADASPMPLVSPGQVVGRVTTAWGSSVPVTASPASIVAWSGLQIAVHVKVESLPSSLPRGARIGVFDVVLGGQHLSLLLTTPSGLSGPSVVWRLTRL